jgi:prepilin-type processing-associated H-X9-DG protein
MEAILAALRPYLTFATAVTGVSALIGFYLGGFLRKLGEDRAALKQLGHVTQIVEGIKHTNDMLVEQFRTSQAHRFLAAEKRLEAHQGAFIQWRRVFDASGSMETLEPAVEGARDWWNKNCLYLDGHARQALNRGLSSVLIWRAGNVLDDEAQRHMKIFFFDTPEAIVKAAKVPALAGDELPNPPSGL